LSERFPHYTEDNRNDVKSSGESDSSQMKDSGRVYSNPRRRVAASVAIALLMPALLFGKVKTFASNDDDIGLYKTYEWLPVRVMTRHGLVEDDALLAPAIRQAVNRELGRRGYREVAEGGNLQVASGGFGKMGSQLEGFLVHWGFDYYWGDWGASFAAPVQRQYRMGTLAVVLVNPETKKGVWGGLATTEIGNRNLDAGSLDKSLAKAIDKAAQNILKRLPKRKS